MSRSFRRSYADFEDRRAQMVEERERARDEARVRRQVVALSASGRVLSPWGEVVRSR